MIDHRQCDHRLRPGTWFRDVGLAPGFPSTAAVTGLEMYQTQYVDGVLTRTLVAPEEFYKASETHEQPRQVDILAITKDIVRGV